MSNTGWQDKVVETTSKVSNMKNTEFKVGDTVWCTARGKGEVTGVNHSGDTYPISVLFNNSTDYYTPDGKMYFDGPRCLFFSEPKVEASVTRPFEPTLKGKKCLVISKADLYSVTKVEIFDETETTIVVHPDGSYWGKHMIKELYEIGPNLLDKQEVSN